MEARQSKIRTALCTFGGFPKAGITTVCTVAAMLLLAGCTGPATRTATPQTTSVPVLNQGTASDVVFSSPDVPQYPESYPAELLPEYGRRDSQLAVSTPGSIYPLDAWPAEPRTSVFMSRRVRVSTDADSFYLFEYPSHNKRRSR